jgi:hypothetical protein
MNQKAPASARKSIKDILADAHLVAPVDLNKAEEEPTGTNGRSSRSGGYGVGGQNGHAPGPVRRNTNVKAIVFEMFKFNGTWPN